MLELDRSLIIEAKCIDHHVCLFLIIAIYGVYGTSAGVDIQYVCYTIYDTRPAGRLGLDSGASWPSIEK